MDESDLITLLETVVRQAAKRLPFERPDEEGLGQLLQTVRQKDPETYALLDAFADAYLEWYRYRRRVMDDSGGAAAIEPDSRELLELIRRRDAARDAVLERARRLE